MLEISRDDLGNILACCEWQLVDEEGHFSPQGQFVWIANFEKSANCRQNGIIKNFIKSVAKQAPTAQFGYFYRLDKYPKKGIKIYTKSQWLRRLNYKGD